MYRLPSIILSHKGISLFFSCLFEPMNEVDALVEEVLKEFLQNSSIIQNISVTLSVVIIAIYVLLVIDLQL